MTLGLVMQHQFIGAQCLANALDGFVVAAQTGVLLGIKQMKPVFAGQLGLVHGLICLTQQLLDINVEGLRVKRHAHAG